VTVIEAVAVVVLRAVSPPVTDASTLSPLVPLD
jgi:hypothetical protein